SRRRHTRFSRDWSSDVCSSDLFYNLCVMNNIKPIIGLNIPVESEMGFYNNVLVYAKGEIGYKNLLSLASQAKLKKVVSQSFLRRSEERRVGKECRYRWWRKHER